MNSCIGNARIIARKVRQDFVLTMKIGVTALMCLNTNKTLNRFKNEENFFYPFAFEM